MLIALSGTPGCGKTTAAEELEARGYQVHYLTGMIEGWGQFGPPDETGSVPVDVDELRDLLGTWAEGLRGVNVLDGHLSYLAPADAVLVLRADPDTIRKRLSSRNYPEGKVMENAEAEGISSVLIYALMEMKDRGREERVFERDITDLTPGECADWAVKMISALKGEDLKSLVRYRPGKVDWTEVISGWY
ncbi:MAG: adenylate kinase family protein [Thermoplasmata archaeon]|nr:adenylate kinase family protein [Thermoplasmata archaeon]